MPLPLLPIAIATLAAGAYAAQSRREKPPPSPKVLAERTVIYDMLINDVKDPEVLRRFSHAFRAEGCVPEADMLLKRAMLRELPPEVKKQRNDLYKRAMASTNVAGIRETADWFESTASTGAAASLRDYAHALERASTSNPRIETPPTESVPE